MPLDAKNGAEFLETIDRKPELFETTDRNSALLDPLARMGITPIPRRYVQHYKKKYHQRFKENYPSQIYAQWRSQRVTLYPKRNLLFWGKSNTADLISQPPQQLLDLAFRVKQEIPTAIFGVDYFYTDPVLSVTYNANIGTLLGSRQRLAYLGVWDGDVLNAIAGDPPMMTDPLPKAWWQFW